MSQIVLLGTHHDDPNGPERLKRRLEEESPDIVICEGREEKELGHQKYIEMLKKEAGKLQVGRSRIRKFLAYEERAGYEIRTFRQFCESRRLPFFYFNDSGHILTPEERERNVGEILKVIQTINPNRAVEEIRAGCEAIYGLLNRVIETPQKIAVVSKLPDYYHFVCPRDGEMETVARRIQGENAGKKVVCVNVYYHILRDVQGLSFYSRIPDLKPDMRLIG